MAAGALASLRSCMLGPTRAPQLYRRSKNASELNTSAENAIRGFAHSADFSPEPQRPGCYTRYWISEQHLI